MARAPERSANGRLRDIAVEDIHANPSQPRKHFDDASLAALADSIRERGVLQPIIVQPRPVGGYELVAGERRWHGSQIAGTTTIPALVAQSLDGRSRSSSDPRRRSARTPPPTLVLGLALPGKRATSDG